jgi:sugar lactone lactonase YvrE
LSGPYIVAEVANVLGEGPRWHPGEQALYWLDIRSKVLYRYVPETGRRTRFDLQELVAAYAFLPDGGYLFATKTGFVLADALAVIKRTLMQPEAENEGVRFNDAMVDVNGRFWAGTLNEDGSKDNKLYRMETDGSLEVIETGVGLANGIGWSPDNRTMYFNDTTRERIYAYDYDPDTGTTSNRRILVDTTDLPGSPDGLAVDEEGGIWVAFYGGSQVLRFDPEGNVIHTIPMPVTQPTACAFGGPDRKTLYITSARQELSSDDLAEQPAAGDLFAYETDVVGLPVYFLNPIQK